MRIIFKTLFGSHLYGLNTPQSDMDYKAVAIPDREDILLQKAFKTVNTTTKPKGQLKNTNEDVDIEIFSLHKFIKLCAEGQTVALDMLFAPKEFWLEDSPEWDYIQAHRDKLIHKNATAFVGYCQKQAAKYGIKGSRVHAVKYAIATLEPFKQGGIRLKEIWLHLKAKFATVEHIDFITTEGNTADLHTKEIETLEICNKKLQSPITVKLALEILTRLDGKFGERAKQAATNDGVDWKAMSHALRVCAEAKDLLSTGHVTLPLKDKKFILEVKQGKHEYKKVAAVLEEQIADVKKLEKESILPESIDTEFWKKFVIGMYSNEVNKYENN